MNHQLIERVQNFTLDRKILSIDSDDRDKEKWPNAAEFELSCPQIYNSIETIRILNIHMPNYFYNISEYLQNNKLIVSIDNGATTNEVKLDDGNYTPTYLQNALEYKLKDVSPNFKVKYNELNRKMYFGNVSTDFSLRFNDTINYTNSCSKKSTYSQHSKWGLGDILGFEKSEYTSQADSSSIVFSHDSTKSWIANDNHIIIPPKNADLNFYQNFYVEIDKLNQSDEIKPYLNNKNSNSNNGIINSFFAKVPFIKSDNNQILVSKDFFLESVSYFQPPLENLSKLRIKLRYHNGLPIDMMSLNMNFSMSLEINQIRNEMKDYRVRTPFTL